MFVDCLNIIIRDGFSVIYFKDTRIEKEISEKHSNKPSSDYKTAFYGKYIVHSYIILIALIVVVFIYGWVFIYTCIL